MRLILISVLALSFSTCSYGQAFSSGSTGAYGPINITSGTQTIQLPPDGIINASMVNISTGATLKFGKNLPNTPVYLLSTGDVVVAGIIDINGQFGKLFADGGQGGDSGPGGFNGASVGFTTDGFAYCEVGEGPGGGKFLGVNGTSCYNVFQGNSGLISNPAEYLGSNSLLVPLIGGSGAGTNLIKPCCGGSFTPQAGAGGGGGGGGAILIASSTQVIVNGTISAVGLYQAPNTSTGSGGAIRLVAPRVSGTGSLQIAGPSSAIGRARIDTLDRSTLALATPVAIGSFMRTGLNDQTSRLEIVSVDGQAVATGSSTVQVLLPPGNTELVVQVVVRAMNFFGSVPAVLRYKRGGSGTDYPVTLVMAGQNTATATIQVNVSAGGLPGYLELATRFR